jgi:Uncharacterized oxidoreductases, Fe-dependent alcohol dehydrogenase family
MNSFVFHTPTKVVFGKDSHLQVGELLKSYGATKVLLHYGGNSATKSGLLDQVKSCLNEYHISFVELGDVVPNPRLSKVHEGIHLGRDEKIDFILAVGGGSVIDSSKAIAYGIPYQGEVWDFFTKKATPETVIPVGTILTIAAAGSEMSNSTVITNEENWEKRGCNFEICRLRFAIENPELTYSLPAYQTASGCVDIMMHTMERYFTLADTMELTDSFAEALLRVVMNNAKILVTNPNDYSARAEVLWASSISHNGLLNCGGDAGDWACHRLEHELSGMFDVAHGAGLAAIWTSWANYVYKEKPERFAQYAKNVFGLNHEDTNVLAQLGIQATTEFFKSLEMPTTILELGIDITDKQIEDMAEKCAQANPSLGAFKKLEKKDMIAIYQNAK